MPSTALALDLLQAPGDADVAVLRSEVSRALAGLCERVIVAAADTAAREGPAWLEAPSGRVDLGGYGLPHFDVEVAASDRKPAVAVHPDGDLTVLAFLVRTAGSLPQLLALPHDPAAVGEVPLTGDLVVAADLAAGHGPKPPRPEAGEVASAAFDDAVEAGLADPETLTELAGDAETVSARGLPALVLAARTATARGLVPRSRHRSVVGGVGGLVVVWEDPSDP